MRTEKELLQESWEIQDACNLSGVIHAFSRAISELWDLQRSEKTASTSNINQHLLCKLYASKIISLTGDLPLELPMDLLK